MLGSVAIHSRKRAVRSPDVGAVNAPPVKLSKADASCALRGGVFTAIQVRRLSPRAEEKRLL